MPAEGSAVVVEAVPAGRREPGVRELLVEPAARALRERTEARLQSVKELAAAQEVAPLALIYLPNGLSPGGGTLKDELLRLAGFRNLTAEQGIRDYGTIGLETLLAHRPALVVLDAVDLEHTSLAQQLLRHPALTAAGTIPTARMPTPLWICGGPQIAEAAEVLLELHVNRRDARLPALPLALH